MKTPPMETRPARKRRAALAASLLALLFLGCFEQPITESMYLNFLPGNLLVVGVTVRLGSEESFQDNPAAKERIDAMRRDLERGDDPWARRLAAIKPVKERMVWDKTQGRLERATRQAATDEPENVSRFFGDTLIQARLHRHEREQSTELTLVPSPGGRASRVQQDHYRESLDPFLTAVSDYYKATGDLYRGLERNPKEANDCFAILFADILGEQPPAGDPPEDLAEAARAARAAMEDAMNLFTVDPEDGQSLEELSRLVVDPFPAPLTIQVPGPILEVEGFVQQPGGILTVPGLSLWQGLMSLKERWLSPDPIFVEVEHLTSKSPLNLDDYSHQPRRAYSPPSSQQLRDALKSSLTPAVMYRVVWRSTDTGGNGTETGEPEDLEELWAPPSAPPAGQDSPPGSPSR